MDTNLGDALSGLLLLSSDSNNDSDDGSMTHIAFPSFSIWFVLYAHAPSLPAVAVMAVAVISVVVVGPRHPRQSAALGNPPPSAICRCRRSAAAQTPPPA
jgi:hypothetical protein